MSESDGPNEAKPTMNKIDGVCNVCGDGASIINYGTLSCLSCRTFFRRNAFHNKDPPVCRFDNKCYITTLTRKVCSACRLAKCLSVGMSPDLIRKEDLGTRKRKSNVSKIEEQLHRMTASRQSSVNSSNDDHLLHLTSSDQTLISNVVHAFDAFSPIVKIRHTIDMLNTSVFKIEYDVSQSLEIMSLFYNSLKSFISSIPDFKILTPAEQCSLFQRNMLGLLCIGGMYLMRESGIFDKPENEIILLPLYGSEVLQQAKTLCQQFNCDHVLLKLMLVALAFSSNCYMLHNCGNIAKDSLLLGTFRLFGSQNVYIELMWKYLIHSYDYNTSVKQISALVKQLLDTLKFSIDLYENNKIHQKFIDDTIQQTETALIVNEKAVVSLWGKNDD